jgi:hypothetical protein
LRQLRDTCATRQNNGTAYNAAMDAPAFNASIGRPSLLSALTSADFPPAVLSAPGRGELFVLPHAGRVIGLFAGGQDENLLWVNPALGEAASAREALAAGRWDLGGDRTWLSPETELHIADLTRAWETYSVPKVVDPGHYTVAQLGQQINMRSPAQVFFHRQQRSSEVEIEKSVRLVADPLRLEAGLPTVAGVDYAGYELTTSLRLVNPPTGGPAISLWNILVAPAAGWAIVPVWRETRARDILEATPPERLLTTRHAVCFRLDGRKQLKISLRAAAVTGRAGYLRAMDAERSSLLVRSFVVNPSGEYIDSPWDAPDEMGYALQSYNDGGVLGAFGEVEYHTPAIGGDTGLARYSDVSQLWAYTGPSPAIHDIAEHLLGAESLRALPQL